MSHRKLIVANFKMHLLASEVDSYIDEFQTNCTTTDSEVIFCPPFTALCTFQESVQGLPYSLGAQNISNESSGAYTGEVSGEMLRDIGCQYVIIGHSERRNLFSEPDRIVSEKVTRALKVGITPIVCIGEDRETYEKGETLTFLLRQIEGSLSGIDILQQENIIIAYEPVWAIGTGKIPSIEEVSFIIQIIHRKYPKSRVLYGGSVDQDTIQTILDIPHLSGVLVGGACLDAASFGKLIPRNFI